MSRGIGVAAGWSVVGQSDRLSQIATVSGILYNRWLNCAADFGDGLRCTAGRGCVFGVRFADVEVTRLYRRVSLSAGMPCHATQDRDG
jgi:hypothetical protein